MVKAALAVEAKCADALMLAGKLLLPKLSVSSPPPP